MAETFDSATIDRLAKELKEPSWVTELRRQALARHEALPWPHPSDDVWRRIDVSQLDPHQGFSPVHPGLLQAIPLTKSQLTELTRPLANEQLCVRLNGTWASDEQAQEAGPSPVNGRISVRALTQAAEDQPDAIREMLSADGFTDAEQKLTTLNAAFHHDDVVVEVPANYAGTEPMRLVHIISAAPKQAIFPLTLIRVGRGSVVTLIDEYVSLPGASHPQGIGGERSSGANGAHLINGRVELIIEPDATVCYVRLQRWDRHAREFLLQRVSLGKGATLTMANINLGAAFSKAHIITRFLGEHASSKLYGFVFGTGGQLVDQHTLQDHRAAHTTSDLAFKAALQDESRMVYTGLIRIAKNAQQTNAFQANHNLLLSDQAHAESIPMLEILADDVQCKHGVSVGPIDEEQIFYLMSRGMPRPAAERLLVMGFVEPIVQQIPFEPLQERLRQEIEGGLHTGVTK